MPNGYPIVFTSRTNCLRTMSHSVIFGGAGAGSVCGDWAVGVLMVAAGTVSGVGGTAGEMTGDGGGGVDGSDGCSGSSSLVYCWATSASSLK